MGHLLTLVLFIRSIRFCGGYLKEYKGWVCNVLFSKKYTILVEAILKSIKGGSSAYFGL